ncbi:hypothetical protein D3C72_1444400 [compost metagenome]
MKTKDRNISPSMLLIRTAISWMARTSQETLKLSWNMRITSAPCGCRVSVSSVNRRWKRPALAMTH